MTIKKCLRWFLPQISYQQAWKLQLEQVEKIISGDAPPTVFFLEHPPVVTIGKGGKEEHLLLPEADLKEKGIECFRVDRGGDVTFHGPGQLVVYLMLKLTGAERDLHALLRLLEEVGIRVLQDYGIQGKRFQGYTGVWVGEEKIMAIGIKVKKWVTCHGLAFNFANNLEGFSMIVPCGIKDKGVTSLHLLLKKNVSREEIEERFAFYIEKVFGLELMPPVRPWKIEAPKEVDLPQTDILV